MYVYVLNLTDVVIFNRPYDLVSVSLSETELYTQYQKKKQTQPIKKKTFRLKILTMISNKRTEMT